MPDWKSEIRERLRGLRIEPAREAAIVEELAQHLEDFHAERVARGDTPEEAERRTLEELRGSETWVRERWPAAGSIAPEPLALGSPSGSPIGDLRQDLRHGARTLRKDLGFTATAVLTLALGIGANAAVFTVVNAVLLRQLPFQKPEQLVWVSSRHATTDNAPFNLPDFIDYRDRNRTLAGIAAYGNWSANLTQAGEPERLSGLRVSADLFQVLGVQAITGRTLQARDDHPGSQRVVVISHGLWRRRFGADPGVVGKTLVLNGESFELVGVLPPQFFFPVREAEVAVPLAPEADPSRNVRSSVNFLRALARLKPGVTRAQAEADLTAVATRLRQEYPANAQKLGVVLRSLHEGLVADFRLALWILLGAVGLVLLIASVNLANLSLTRAASRHREMAVRAALGATPWRLARQLGVESLLLALLGGGIGLLLANYGIGLLVAFSPPDLPRMAEIDIDQGVLWFTLGLSLLSGVIVGLAPALEARRVNLVDELKGSRLGTSDGRRRRRARSLLVIAEVSVSLVLLIAAGLLIESFIRVQRVDPGFQAEKVLAIRLSLPKERYASRAAATAFHDALSQRLESLPGVEAVGVVSALPLSGILASVPFTIDGRAAAPDERLWTNYRLASSGYFRTLEIPLVAGREFNAQDTERTAPVAIISRSFAHRFWPGGNPIGAHLHIDDNDHGPRPVEIVGVVGDVRHLGLDREPEPHLYLPLQQTHEDTVGLLTNNQYWLLRTGSEPMALAQAVRGAIRATDPDVPSSSVHTLPEFLASSVAPRRFNAWLLTLFAGAALIIAGTGLYGVISQGVAQRTHEIGVRMALGARRGDVLRLVIAQGMALAGIGVAIGLAVSLALTRLMASLLFSVSAADPAIYASIALLLLAVALLACYLPARRASRIPPITALRC